MKFVFAGMVGACSLLLLIGSNEAGQKAKHTIAEVMKEAHKGKLMQKVASGKASSDEKKTLVELYQSLQQSTPPKGEAGDWKERTGKLVEAAQKAAKGDEAAAKSLPKLADCKGCHSVHK